MQNVFDMQTLTLKRVAAKGSALLLCLLPIVENGNISLPVSDTVDDYSPADTDNTVFW